MNPHENIIQMVQLMDRPAFCVLNGTILAANQAALDRMVPVSESVAAILCAGQAEYAAFAGQQIALTVQLGDIRYAASVYAVGQYHIFKLEPSGAGPQLQALALAAQQLRQPLSNIMLTTNQMFAKLELPENSPAADQMARVNRSLNVLQRMVGNMSDAARFSNEPARMELRDVDAVLREIFEQAGVLCEYADVHLEFTGLNASAYSLIDSERLERAVYNIVSNAMKAMSGSGSIQAKLIRKANTLYLTVQDSGCGIASAANAFDRYLREPAIEDGKEGLGMGMKLIRACADAHGGTVILDSSESGLRLTMSLPIRLEGGDLRTPRVDYAGERNHGLMELAESLPHTLYKPKQKH